MRAFAPIFASFALVALGTQAGLAQAEVTAPNLPPPLIGSETPAAPSDEVISLEPPARDAAAGATPAAPAAPAPAPVAVTTQDTEGATTTPYQDWVLECFETPGSCQITHRVMAGGGNQIVVVLALTSEADKGPARVQIAVPLGISASAGLRLAIGAEYQANIAIARCTPQGCIVEGTASDALLAAFRNGRQGRISVLNASGAAVDLPFSLMGFSAAYTAMIEQNAAAGG